LAALPRGAREDDAVVLDEHLGEVLTVEAGVGAGGQLDHPGRQGGVQGVRRSAPTVAMGQGRCTPEPAGGAQPAHLADGDAEKLGRLR
jgi:hypothetical protein